MSFLPEERLSKTYVVHLEGVLCIYQNSESATLEKESHAVD